MIDLCSQKQQRCCDRFTQIGIVFTKTVRDQSGLFYQIIIISTNSCSRQNTVFCTLSLEDNL